MNESNANYLKDPGEGITDKAFKVLILIIQLAGNTYIQIESWAAHFDGLHCMCNAYNPFCSASAWESSSFVEEAKGTKAILVIILMAPIYSVVSYVGLIGFRGSESFFMLLESVKECYEALVMAKFLALLYTYLNKSISKNIVPDEIKGREIHHSFPMTLFQNLTLLKHWTWQFVIIRPVCSVLMIALQLLDIYPGWLSWTFAIILNISVSLALYSLVIFYHVFAKELAPYNPLAKFMCVKGIVFFCFWQALSPSLLVEMGIIKSHHIWLDVEHIQTAYQNILVIVEMVLFSIFQMHAYSAAPYADEAPSRVKDKKNE